MTRCILLVLLASLSLTACQVGVVKRDELPLLTSPLAPDDTPSSPTPGTESALADTSPLPSPTPAPAGAELQLVGRFGHNVTHVAVQGDYAYLIEEELLLVLEVSDPAQPALVGQLELGYVHGLQVAGDYAYVVTVGDCQGLDWGCQVALWIVDVSDPSAPVQEGVYKWSQQEQMPWVVRMEVLGPTLYLTDASAGLFVFDVSNPSAPAEVFRQEGMAWSVAVAGHHVHVLYSHIDMQAGYWQVLDATNPLMPAVTATYEVQGYDWGAAPDIVPAGDYAYLTDGQNGLSVMDISNPLALGKAGGYPAPQDDSGLGAIGGAVVADDRVYVISVHGGEYRLRVLDLSDPVLPIETAVYDFETAIWDLAAADDHLYVACLESPAADARGDEGGLFIWSRP